MTDEKKEDKALSKNVEKLVEDISKLSVMELSDLVNALQDKLGVSAMPVAQAAAPVASQQGAEAGASEGSGGGGTVILTAVKDKVPTIKAIREINQNITLPDAKAMTENLPAEIVKDAKPDAAKEAAEKLRAVGATVEMK
ncbi:ribosomal protein L7/L12 [Candidatus Woesebacteria bacterium]|nr:MAG: ribosomal protein L7/L12 [Candidatus Woesebacteria bacterium]